MAQIAPNLGVQADRQDVAREEDLLLRGKHLFFSLFLYWGIRLLPCAQQWCPFCHMHPCTKLTCALPVCPRVWLLCLPVCGCHCVSVLRCSMPLSRPSVFTTWSWSISISTCLSAPCRPRHAPCAMLLCVAMSPHACLVLPYMLGTPC